MDLNKANKVEANRRRAFRVYEQVDLFYHKVTPEQIVDNHGLSHNINAPSFEQKGALESLSLNSYSEENVTLNVNISSSGISFTSKDELIPGEYLMIRVLLLSSMTVIMTCSRVVYVKPSNPFEQDQYPYLIGAQFINLQTEDKDLLDRHVDMKKSRQLMSKGLMASLIGIILLAPDFVFDTVLGVCDLLLEYFIEAIHILYEVLEYSLDHLVETLFHTGLHETEVVVFYIQIVLACLGMYAFYRALPSLYKGTFYRLYVFYHRKKSSFFYYWKQKTVGYKAGMISLGLTVVSCYILFFI